MPALTYYCFHCYGKNDRPAGPCAHCGRPIEAPSDASYADLLNWALHHPLPDVATRAAAILGQRREPSAVSVLQELACQDHDPFLAAQALRSLIAIQPSEVVRPLLERLAVAGSVPVRAVAQRALRAERRAREGCERDDTAS